MAAQAEHPVDEIKRLRACLNDLVSVLALPAIWTGGEPAHIVNTLVDALVSMLHLDLVYVRLNGPNGNALTETVRIASSGKLAAGPPELCRLISHWLGDVPHKWPPVGRKFFGGGDIALVPLRLGLHGDIGVIVAGAKRKDFPQQTESLLLNIAANQASIGLHDARRLSEQKRIADELDQRVALRTRELAAANDELREAHEQAARSEAFLAEGQRLSLTGSFSWRLNTDEITFSEELLRIFEFELDAVVTLEKIVARVHPADVTVLTNKIETARRGGGDLEYEIRLCMPDQRIKYVRTLAHGMRDQEGNLEYVGAVQDVTQRRLADEALDRVRAELSNVTRVMSVGTMTASIAHEVNQPLSGIITNASTCLRMLASELPNIEGARETAKRTIRDANRASEVVTRLRALYSKKEPVFEALNLNDAVREVIELSANELQRNRIELRAELADGLPNVNGDRVQLQQVILNLLRNASDAMGALKDQPRKLLIRTERDQSNCVRASVQDSGIGFDPQSEEKLFEAFHTSKTEGMGMGLAVSRSIIESHNGRIWATLNEGPGATFTFSIPCDPLVNE